MLSSLDGSADAGAGVLGLATMSGDITGLAAIVVLVEGAGLATKSEQVLADNIALISAEPMLDGELVVVIGDGVYGQVD